jgi:hypothetical protein
MIDVTRYRGVSLGCGLIYQGPDILHVDCRPTRVTDAVMDLDQMPWNLPSSWADMIIAHDIIEHVDDAIGFMQEVWRIGTPSAMVYVRGPFHGHPQAYRAMDHKRYLALDSLDLFIPGTEYFKGYSYYTQVRFEKVDCQYAGAEIVWTLRKAPTDDGKWDLP